MGITGAAFPCGYNCLEQARVPRLFLTPAHPLHGLPSRSLQSEAEHQVYGRCFRPYRLELWLVCLLHPSEPVKCQTGSRSSVSFLNWTSQAPQWHLAHLHALHSLSVLEWAMPACACPVVSNSLWPSSLLCPRDFPGMNWSQLPFPSPEWALSMPKARILKSALIFSAYGATPPAYFILHISA